MIRNLCIISLFFARMLTVYGLLSFVSLVSLRCSPNMWWSCWCVGKKVLVVTSQRLFGGAIPLCLLWTIGSKRNCWTFEGDEQSLLKVKGFFLLYLCDGGLQWAVFEFLHLRNFWLCSFLLIFHVHFLCTWGLSCNLGFFFNKTLTIKKIKPWSILYSWTSIISAIPEN